MIICYKVTHVFVVPLFPVPSVQRVTPAPFPRPRSAPEVLEQTSSAH